MPPRCPLQWTTARPGDGRRVFPGSPSLAGAKGGESTDGLSIEVARVACRIEWVAVGTVAFRGQVCAVLRIIDHAPRLHGRRRMQPAGCEGVFFVFNARSSSVYAIAPLRPPGHGEKQRERDCEAHRRPAELSSERIVIPPREACHRYQKH